MPLVILHPVPPLPPLTTYLTISLVLLAWSVFQAREDLSILEESDIPSLPQAAQDFGEAEYQMLNLTHIFQVHEDDYLIVKYMKMMAMDSWSVLVLCNVAFCVLLMLGIGVQWIVFGQLRVSERQGTFCPVCHMHSLTYHFNLHTLNSSVHLRDKLWNFAFYKFIVIFGVLNVQTLEELIFWVAWFAVFAFLHAFAQLSKDRFEYLSFSPTTATSTHAKVLGLLTIILCLSVALGAVGIAVGNSYGWNLFLFMLAECVLLGARSLHVIMKYSIHLYDLHYEGVWEKRGQVVYYTELIMELVCLAVDFMHHVHMLLWGNVFLSMASLVICLQIRYLYNEVQRRIQRHRNYRRVVNNMEKRFSLATAEELIQNNDDCAICWEEMKSARKLPCGHLFHDGCLRSWLEHETSCPTCRQSLNSNPSQPQVETPRRNLPQPPMAPMMNGGHFFHFDGSRIASWMPSFSVEVTHGTIPRRGTTRTSQLDNLALQVTQMFPHIPIDVALRDLQVTRSVEQTVENILEGRLDGIPTQPPDTPDLTSPPVIADSQNVSVSSSGDNTYSPLLRTEADSAASLPNPSQPNESSSSIWHQTAPFSSANQEVPKSNSEDALTHPPSGALAGAYGDNAVFGASAGRFSKSSKEREEMLKSRKEQLLQAARRRFTANQTKSPVPTSQPIPAQPFTPSISSTSPSTFTMQTNQDASQSPSNDVHLAPAGTNQPERGDSDPVRRRNLVLEATLRRLNQSTS